MSSRLYVILAVVIAAVIAGILALSLSLTPDNLNPAYAAAVDFSNAAGQATAPAAQSDADPDALMAPALRQHVQDSCPDGDLLPCIDAYTPDLWGGMLITVFRRARPDGPSAWDVLLVATYEEDQGFSGVCIYNRVEQLEQPPEEADPYAGWRVTRWSGFVSCDAPNAGLDGLRAADAPNRAPID